MHQNNAMQSSQQNEEELTRLMTSPVRSKMQYSGQKLGDSQQSQKTGGSSVSKATLMVGAQSLQDG